MDNDTLIDLKLKVKFRLSEYLERQSFRWTSLIRRIPERFAPAAADTPRCCVFPLILRSTFGPAPNARQKGMR